MNTENLLEEQDVFYDKDEKYNIRVIQDENGKNIVIINDIRFKSRRNIDWNQIEDCLKEYIGKCYQIIETSETIYIGTDFTDEFSHSVDTKKMKGINIKAKANAIAAIGELVQVATNKSIFEDYNGKHKSKARYGWHRYDTRFGIPVYDEEGNLERYNIFSARMLVRCDADGLLYLYDFVRTKKKRAGRLSNRCTVVNFVPLHKMIHESKTVVKQNDVSFTYFF